MSARAGLVVERLSRLSEPVSASDLAESIGLPFVGHETRRRRVREAVEEARQAGRRICANADGYWLARSHTEWRDYLESRKRGARFEFVRTGHMSRAATEAGSGQMLLIPGCARGQDLAWM